MGNTFRQHGGRPLRRRPEAAVCRTPQCTLTRNVILEGSAFRVFSYTRASLLSLLFGLLVLTLSASSQAELTVEVKVQVAAYLAGKQQLVRFSLPLPRGLLLEGTTLQARVGKKTIPAAVRPLTWYPAVPDQPRSARCAIVNYLYEFTHDTVTFTFARSKPVRRATVPLPVVATADSEGVTIAYKDGRTVRATLIAPTRTSRLAPRLEVVEDNEYYRWTRLHVSDDKWPRILEVRVDATGRVAMIGHLQSREPGHGYAPDLGWEVKTACTSALLDGRRNTVLSSQPVEEPASGADAVSLVWWPPGRDLGQWLYHPMQPLNRRGTIRASIDSDVLNYRYLRCIAAEKVPMQMAAWRRADLLITSGSVHAFGPTPSPPVQVITTDWKEWDRLYSIGPPTRDLLPGNQADRSILSYHDTAGLRSMAVGDDAGNVTGYSDGAMEGGAFGMNRLNHCTAIFAEGLRTNNPRLIETGLLWCDNFYDLSIWWGPGQTGGTRYNNVAAMGEKPPPSDPPFMWRSNSAVSFCTKGFDAFFIAYELTGDPRYMEALNAQVDYASKHMTAGENYTRNVGCVKDFLNLYNWTGEQRYLDQALRLFRELRTQLSTGDLFTESGKPIVADSPFIELDAQGYQHPFAKPYILGYALEGLPELLKLRPNEPKLREVVAAVAAFMVKSQDPAGGWRYPHPRSSYVIMSQAMEHAWQIMQADMVLPKSESSSSSSSSSNQSPSTRTRTSTNAATHEARLDAIERVLRQRIHGWLKTGKVWSGITGWEMPTGRVTKQEEIPALYRGPEDRDFRRDYTEGRADFGSAPPEGIVYFPEVLRYYLKHRPASRLLAAPKAGEPLHSLLTR